MSGEHVLEQTSGWGNGNSRLATSVDLVIPVHNEEGCLEASVRRLDEYLSAIGVGAVITIADNASGDHTWAIAQRLADGLPRVRALRLDRKGRGLALKAAWCTSTADVVGYMDVDLSTDLRALLPLLAPLLSGHSDLAIGTRLARGSRVIRGPKREVISRGYNLLLRGVLSAGFSDAQCGFKAIRREVADRLLPLVEDDGWFFDTELLILAEEAGLRIHEVPVDWVDDPNSRVDIAMTVGSDLRGVVRLAKSLVRGTIDLAVVRRSEPLPTLPAQAMRFIGVGVLSTLAYLALYLLGRTVVDAQAANFLALLSTTIANTAANRRLTFRIRTRAGMIRDHLVGLAACATGLVLTSGALGVLHATDGHPARRTEVVVLITANALATLVRFAALRQAMARPSGTAQAAPPRDGHLVG